MNIHSKKIPKLLAVNFSILAIQNSKIINLLSRETRIILGIETSCDDTSIAVLKGHKILANCVSSQMVHQAFGGVVPELASRSHIENITPILAIALKKAKITLQDVQAIAFTQGPGLLGSLMVGTSFAKGLALALDIPLIAVHHMKAHIMAHFIQTEDSAVQPNFPFLCLTVSGGHTQIVKVNAVDDMEIVGKTLDDAAGEAFDKSAKMLGLPYPGGPLIDQLAKKGNPDRFQFAKPNIEDFDFSFSGVKTSILYKIQKEMKQDPLFLESNLNDLCASIQKGIVEILMDKLLKASQKLQIKTLAIAGGVSANSELRKRLVSLKEQEYKVHIPKFEYCTDNAAMIAITGQYLFDEKQFVGQNIAAKAKIDF